VALIALGVLSGYAPYQCGKGADRSVREETPGEALYGLAQKLKADGDVQGYRTTLRYIIARYPSSRFATSAKVDLEADGIDAGSP
jgi:TolA-binding protein